MHLFLLLPRPLRSATLRCLALAVLVLGGFAAPAAAQDQDEPIEPEAAEPEAADPEAVEPDAVEPGGTLSGTLFHDLDNDGRLDAGEPGIPGVVVRLGGVVAWAVTDDDGYYEFVDQTGVASLTVQTGWFRSQCDSLDCPVGPGPDNDFPVENQRIKLSDLDLDAGGEFNLGLLPAWGIAYPIPADPTSNPYDVATRITKIGGCDGPGQENNTCDPGDVVDGQIELHNQGTEPVDSITFALRRPRDTTWWTEPFLPDGYNPEGHRISAVGFDPTTNSGIYRVDGPIAPGAMAFLFVQVFVTDEGPATREPVPTNNPFDRALQVRIIDMVAGGPDADSFFCYGTEPADCDLNTGPHSKLNRTDDSDGMGWNVGGDVYLSTYDLALTVSTPANEVAVGDELDLTISIANQGSGDSDVANIAVVIDLPDHLELIADANPGWVSGPFGVAEAQIPGPLATGATAVLSLQVTAIQPTVCDVPSRTFAEIADFGNAEDDQVGNQLPIDDQQVSVAGLQVDIDSIADRNPTNDGPIIDNQVNGNPGGEISDEDDSDVVLVAIATADGCIPIATTGVPTTTIGLALMGGAAVLGVGATVAKTKRNRRGASHD